MSNEKETLADMMLGGYSEEQAEFLLSRGQREATQIASSGPQPPVIARLVTLEQVLKSTPRLGRVAEMEKCESGEAILVHIAEKFAKSMQPGLCYKFNVLSHAGMTGYHSQRVKRLIANMRTENGERLQHAQAYEMISTPELVNG